MGKVMGRHYSMWEVLARHAQNMGLAETEIDAALLVAEFRRFKQPAKDERARVYMRAFVEWAEAQKV